ncbi:MAG: protein kinase [Alistipes sp.]|nr:protein kinase [Alistipes sp.]
MTQQEFYSRYSYNPMTDTLGRGGFGAVFKAYDKVDDLYVALKVSQVDLRNPELRLREEVKKAKELNHPNVARYEACYTFPTTSGEEDIAVMRYYEAGSLQTIIRTTQLSLDERYDILRQILLGIGYLHTHNIIHRDLKPQNVLIVHHASGYIPKITDFGISKQLDDGESSAVSNSLLGGTRAYASPEQLAENNIRKNTDLWSFGVLAYQMLTGELPFNSGSFSPTSAEGYQEQSRQMKSGILPELLCSVAEPWQRLIRECLVVDNTKRLAHVEDCLAILDGGVGKGPLVAETQLAEVVAKQSEVKPRSDQQPPLPPAQQPKPDAESKRQPKRNKWLWLLLLLAVIVVVCGIVLSGGEDKEEDVVVTPDTELVVADSLDTSEIEINAASDPVSESVKAEKPAEPAIKLTSKPKASVSADSGSGKISYAVTNPSDGVKPKVKSSADWLVVTMSGNTISYTTTANPSDKSRSAKITIIYGDESIEIVITQAGKPKPSLELTSPSSASVTADGGGGKVEYTLTNRRDDVKLSVNSSADWLIVKVSGDTITYTTKANPNESSRSAKITVTYGDQSFEIVITQAGKPKPKPKTVVPEAKTYNIGDYYNENGKRGVVFEVWDGGRHGKIVSLDETTAAWDSRVMWVAKNVCINGTRTYADSKSDGKANTDKIMARSDSDYFPPFKWCRAKGSSWYLPSLNELKSIYNNKRVLNAVLSKYGTILKDRRHWSSTEYVDNKPEVCAWLVNMYNGYTNLNYKNLDIYVRAVSAF